MLDSAWLSGLTHDAAARRLRRVPAGSGAAGSIDVVTVRARHRAGAAGRTADTEPFRLSKEREAGQKTYAVFRVAVADAGAWLAGKPVRVITPARAPDRRRHSPRPR